MKKSIPQSALFRVGKLLGVGASVAMRELKHRIVEHSGEDSKLAARLEQAETLVEALSQLKGAAMKAGQMLSLELSDMLPPEVSAILSRLHDDSVAMPYEQVEEILRKGWGAEAFERVEDLTREPIAAASIGQVHRGIIDGRQVAIKIQFPGVAKSIKSDLAAVKKVVDGYIRIAGKSIPTDQAFKEVEKIMRQETNYLKEQEHMELYRAHFAGDERYVIPKPLVDWTRKNILTMSYEQGMRLKKWVARDHEDEEVARFAKAMIELILREFFEVGLVQSDPNLGNFLVEPESGRIVLLDFGAVRSYSKTFRRTIRGAVKSALRDERDAVLAYAYKHGFLDERESEEAKDAFYEMMSAIGYAFDRDNQPFDFGDLDYLQELREMVKEFLRLVRYSAPIKDLILVNRKMGGVFHILKDLSASEDLWQQWQRVLAVPL